MNYSSTEKPQSDSPSGTDAPEEHNAAPIDWFRQASPYIKTHRGTTLVLHICGEYLDNGQLSVLAHDIALLSHLGLRLVLVNGLRPQINQRLQEAGVEARVVAGQRVTDNDTLAVVRACAGEARIELESKLSMGLVNTPMAGAHLSVASGNFVTAQPVGVRDGVDFGHSGQVRKIHADAIAQQLSNGHIVLLPPIGFSRTGELFNLQSEQLAAVAAASLNAEKLVYLSGEQFTDADGAVAAEWSKVELEQALGASSESDTSRIALLEAVHSACESGVPRIHVLDRNDRNALLQELFTRDGAGTLVSATQFDAIRRATIDDIGGIIELIEPLEADGTLVARSREQLELEIDSFSVCEREGMITACAALIVPAAESHSPNRANDAYSPGSSPDAFPTAAEIACMVTHHDYRGGGRADLLLAHLEKRARDAGVQQLFVLTTRTGHWFVERGFIETNPGDLPAGREYNLQRNSRVLIKPVG